jgi:protein-S-isoprenylcysteine O-methyltransferase Ste14
LAVFKNSDCFREESLVAMHMITIILLYLVFLLFSFGVFHVVVKRDYLEKGRLTLVSILLEFLVFAFHANLPYLYIPASWPWLPPLEQHPIMNTAGIFLMLNGMIGVVTAMSNLGLRATIGQPKERFHCEGLYRWSRNPQIITYGLVVLGFALLWPSFFSVLWVMLYGIVSHIMVCTEEEYLEKTYGFEYENYCEKVPRYLTVPKTMRSTSK